MDIPQHTFPETPITFSTPTWQHLDELLFVIAQKIYSKQVKIDRVVTLAKGGWPIARTLVDYLGISQVSSIGLKFYTSIGETQKEPSVYQDLHEDFTGKKILLLDDVADTGESLLYAQQYLLEKGAQAVSIATVFYKKHSKIEPDFYADTTDSWIVFPYETRETIQILTEKWIVESVKKEEILERFQKFGFNQEIASYFLQQVLTKKGL